MIVGVLVNLMLPLFSGRRNLYIAMQEFTAETYCGNTDENTSAEHCLWRS